MPMPKVANTHPEYVIFLHGNNDYAKSHQCYGIGTVSVVVAYNYITSGGPGSSVGIATDYGLEGPGSNPGGDGIFRPSRPAIGPIQPPLKWVPGLSRG